MPPLSVTRELQRQQLLLRMERDAEREAFRRQTEAVGIRRSLKRGYAWHPLRVGRSYYNSLNQLCVELFRLDDNDVEHNFEYGRPVEFFTMGKEKDAAVAYVGVQATVSFAEADRMVAVVSGGDAVARLQSATGLGVQLSFDETSYRAMSDALDRTLHAKGRLAYLRDLFYSGERPETFSFAPMSFPWLNATQEKAVNEVLRAKDVAVVHGPPGTGKTTTLVEAIHETLRRETQVLVCAQSNMAVDWISEKLQERGVSVLRLGNPTRVDDAMLASTYERRFEAHPDYPQLWAVRRAIRQLRSQKSRGGASHDKIARLREHATELEVRINADLFSQAKVIACTLVGSASKLLDGMKFTTLFVDEAAQALEAACWIAIRRAQRVVFAGDHCQLPPTVKCREALEGGLGRTLMELVAERLPMAVTMLCVQYRMNERIMRFSSEWFYGGRVESAPSVRNRGILDFDCPITWVDTSAAALGEDGGTEDAPATVGEEFVGETFGRVNKAEAALTLDILEQYFRRIGRQRVIDERIDVGVISPYRAQVQLLRRMFSGRDFFKPLRRAISVNTVDGFQGQERDVMLISLVRSNAEGQIGFLSDLRRMNVAITRARMKLIILGDASTLCRHRFYRRLWEYANEEE